MPKPKSNKRKDVTDTVSAINAPESNFHALAGRACDLIAHHNERGSKVVEDGEGMIPHN